MTKECMTNKRLVGFQIHCCIVTDKLLGMSTTPLASRLLQTAAVAVASLLVGAAAVAQSTGYVCNQANAAGTVAWSVSGGTRTGVSSNGLPRFAVLDYCPFGAGGLYCGTYAWCPSRDFGTAGELCMSGSAANYSDAFVMNGSPWGAAAADAATACSGATSSWVSKPCPTGSAAGTGHYDCPTTKATTYTMSASPLPVSQVWHTHNSFFLVIDIYWTVRAVREIDL